VSKEGRGVSDLWWWLGVAGYLLMLLAGVYGLYTWARDRK
jgi:hypothetical protein